MSLRLKLPNTFVLIFGLLVVIAVLTWFVPGGKYATVMAEGKPVIDPTSYQAVPSHPQGPAAVLMAPIKGFVEAGLIIGFVLIVGGAFAVLQATQAIDALIKSVAQAHERSALVRTLLIPGFVLLFSLGGATFGMAEEAIPFVLIFVPLALALRYDTFIGVAIPFVGSQVDSPRRSSTHSTWVSPRAWRACRCFRGWGTASSAGWCSPRSPLPS